MPDQTPAPPRPFLAFFARLLPILAALLLGLPLGAIGLSTYLRHTAKPAPASAPYVKLPATLEVAQGENGQLTADTNGHTVNWIVPPALYRAQTPGYSSDQFVFRPVTQATVGVWTIWAYTALGDVPSAPSKCIVTVKAEAPTPVPPGPGPDPKPVPPAPTDPLTLKIAAAWQGESATDKVHATDLAQLHRQATKTAQDKALTTCKALHDTIKAARVALMGEALPKVRAVINAELDASLPTSTTAPLDDQTRVLCVNEFTKVATAVETACK